MEFLEGFSKQLHIYDEYKEMEFIMSDDASPLIGCGFNREEIKKCKEQLSDYYYNLLCSIAMSKYNLLIDKYTLPMIVDILKKFEDLNIYYNYSKLIEILTIMMKRPLPIDILIYIFTIDGVGFTDRFILISHMVKNKMLRDECYDLLLDTHLRDRVIGKIK